MNTFKQWLLENDDAAEKVFKRWENFIHHAAEEELISCKVNEVVLMTTSGIGSSINFIADCNDMPRNEGKQPDLSEKLTKRFLKHRIPLLSPITANVFHLNVDPR